MTVRAITPGLAATLCSLAVGRLCRFGVPAWLDECGGRVVFVAGPLGEWRRRLVVVSDVPARVLVTVG